MARPPSGRPPRSAATGRLASRGVGADVANEDSVEAAIAQVEASLPPIIGLANVAGVSSPVDFLDLTLADAHALGMYDPEASLPNRLHFRSEADKLLGDVKDNGRTAMLFVDLDRFKMVNDSLGHARGDQLIMVANRLRVVVNAEFTGNARLRPLLARLAGDELRVLPRRDIGRRNRRVARRVVLAISEPFELCSHSVDIGASIGVAISPDHGTSIESF